LILGNPIKGVPVCHFGHGDRHLRRARRRPGVDPASIRFCHTLGLNYVSCSPYRVPVARLAAAQAAMETKECDR
jgi:hypothetical protein